MWLEADCNLTSGESLVRQFIHGSAFPREFGVDNRILWLPDVFLSGALPQIMKERHRLLYDEQLVRTSSTKCRSIHSSGAALTAAKC